MKERKRQRQRETEIDKHRDTDKQGQKNRETHKERNTTYKHFISYEKACTAHVLYELPNDQFPFMGCVFFQRVFFLLSE